MPGRSEIAQPNAASALLQLGKPPAHGIQHDHDEQPHGVDSAEAEPVVRRIQRPAITLEQRTNKKSARAAIPQVRDEQGDRMDQKNVNDIKKERHPTENDERSPEFAEVAIKQGEHDEGRAKRHQKKEQRGRIFLAFDEREDGKKQALLPRPRERIAIDVRRTDDNEGGTQTDAEP